MASDNDNLSMPSIECEDLCDITRNISFRDWACVLNPNEGNSQVDQSFSANRPCSMLGTVSRVRPISVGLDIPDTVRGVVSLPGTGVVVNLIKTDQSIVYVQLFGDSVPRSRRFEVINALENYFSVYGKIRDVGRLKEKYSYLGDFFVVFENEEDAVECSACHSDGRYTLYPSFQLKLDPYQMTVW
jgi:hypothetical protein